MLRWVSPSAQALARRYRRYCLGVSIGADVVGVGASAVEIWAGEPGHVLAGTFSIATLGLSRFIIAAHRRPQASNSIGPFEDELERFVVMVTVEGPLIASRFITSGPFSAYDSAANRLVPEPIIR